MSDAEPSASSSPTPPPEVMLAPPSMTPSGSTTARRLRPPPAAPAPQIASLTATYKTVFLKGLATLLPTLVTLWVFTAVYGFIDGKIASPINGFLKQQLIETDLGNRAAVAIFDLTVSPTPVPSSTPNAVELERERRTQIDYEVNRHFPSWLGFALAILAVFVVGFFIASFIGRSLWQLMEASLSHIPIVRSVYPSAKQMVEFIMSGEESRRQWSAVVAIEYPRKGLWTIGYVTGRGIDEISQKAGQPVRAVFLPASPTSMTGYVVIAQLSEIVELDMTVDEALKFTISGGVVSPTGERPSSQRLKMQS